MTGSMGGFVVRRVRLVLVAAMLAVVAFGSRQAAQSFTSTR
jgi:hypothetical protein